MPNPPVPLSSPFSSPVLSYQVLARKYRLKSFPAMIGQGPLVKILTHCIEKNQVPQAFLFAGIRGVGKTTAARILARALNCVGKDGQGGPTISPCQDCEHCQAMDEDRHLDVIEMDAASHTGVEDIREVIEAAKYKTISARYKIYIIDEVHMLSKSAFNALLKTLEEPPPHVKFIFATTEVRRIPDTVLSRCMRFDLARISVEELSAYFAKVVGEEKREAEEGALRLIAKAAEGSVRDGLSLLDQALALSSDKVTAPAVREMLHLSETCEIVILFEHLIKGDTAAALALYGDLYSRGKEAVALAHQLLEVTTWIANLKVSPESGDTLGLEAGDGQKMREIGDALSMPVLMRFWQVLLKGIQDMQGGPSPFQAGQMVLIRLAYLSPLPSLNSVIASLKEDGLEKEKGEEQGKANPEEKLKKQEASENRDPLSQDPLLQDSVIQKALETFPGAKLDFLNTA